MWAIISCGLHRKGAWYQFEVLCRQQAQLPVQCDSFVCALCLSGRKPVYVLFDAIYHFDLCRSCSLMELERSAFSLHAHFHANLSKNDFLLCEGCFPSMCAGNGTCRFYGHVIDGFFLLIALWSRHVKPSSAKGEKRLKRKKIPKFVQAEALPESEIMYKSKDHCTGMKDRITRDREIQRYAKTYQKPSPQTSVHLEQQVELRKKVESGSTIADSEAA